jgi:hypothetical protein
MKRVDDVDLGKVETRLRAHSLDEAPTRKLFLLLVACRDKMREGITRTW